MKTLDYKLLLALDAVIREQNFERAAQRLHITQSAISQRIKQLEQQFAEPLIIRSQPLQATGLGQKLLAHYRQVRQLELELAGELSPDEPRAPIRVSIAVNADSLATWFLPALAPLLEQYPIELNLLVDDESRTLDRVREGQAFGAVSLQPQPLAGCCVDELGEMRYLLTASPAFVARHFPNGLTAAALAKAPAVAFDQRDDMHISYMARHFALPPVATPATRCDPPRPSSPWRSRGWPAASSRNCRSASNWKRGACSISTRITTWSSSSTGTAGCWSGGCTSRYPSA